MGLLVLEYVPAPRKLTGSVFAILRSRWNALLAAAIALAIMLLVWHAHATPFSNYVFLADAWLHGHFWIDFPGPVIDAVPYHGHYHVVEAPMPAILMLPFVAAFATNANQTLLANIVGAVSVYPAWRLCQRFALSRIATACAVAFLFFGTSLFVGSTEGDVWLLAHVTAVCFTLFALSELYGKGRPWLVAILAMGAMFSRYSLIVAIPFFLLALLIRRPTLNTVLAYLAPVLPLAALLGWYNLENWGSPWASGYAIWYRIMDPRYRADTAILSLENLSSQLQLYFVRPPEFVRRAPWIVPPMFGFAISYTSAPFLYALWAAIGWESALLWLVTLGVAIPDFLYYDTGGMQFGVRHALDFEPFLFALLVMALGKRAPRAALVAMLLFAALGAYLGLVWILVPGVH